MFMGPFDQMLPWSTESIIGSRRFLDKVWRIANRVITSRDTMTSLALENILHKTIKKVTEDIENFAFNTAISSMMIITNEIESAFASGQSISQGDFKKFLQILSPFAPHLSEEIWSELKEKKSITKSEWPKWDENKIIDEDIKIVVQINGKVRTEIIVSKDETEEKIKEIVLSNEIVKNWMAGKEAKRFIIVPGRLVNIVV